MEPHPGKNRDGSRKTTMWGDIPTRRWRIHLLVHREVLLVGMNDEEPEG
jgi:hypothetical protein